MQSEFFLLIMDDEYQIYREYLRHVSFYLSVCDRWKIVPRILLNLMFLLLSGVKSFQF